MLFSGTRQGRCADPERNPAKSGHAVMKPHAQVPICDDLPPKGRALLLTHTRFIPGPTGSQKDHSLLSTTQDRKGDSPGT